jgi:uncharacterized protein (DUF305 family)
MKQGLFLMCSLFLIALNTPASPSPYQDGWTDNVQTMGARPYDLKFIDEMTSHHAGGIKMAQLALSKSQHPEIKTMAQKMIDDQGKDIAEMAAWRSTWFGKSTDIESRSVGMNLTALENASSTDFDLMFLDSMIMHHPSAIYLGEEAQGNAQHTELKTLANEISKKQKSELKMMRKMRDTWF